MFIGRRGKRRFGKYALPRASREKSSSALPRMTLRRRRRVTSRGFRPERRRENRTPSPRKSDRALSLYDESGKTPSGRKVARKARNRTKTLSHIQPSGSKAYASNERLFAARDEAPQRAFKSSRVHRPPRFPTFKAQISAIFSFAGDSYFARKIKKIQIHATT